MVEQSLILEVKRKKEFSGLPDSIIQKSLFLNKGDVKLTRKFLRKYFGVFLTNKVLKPKNLENYKEVLNSHISSKKRDYDFLYVRISESIGNNFSCIFDLGAGINGFSYPYIQNVFGEIGYIGLESSKQLCVNTNLFFDKMKFKKARCFHSDLFDLDFIKSKTNLSDNPKLFLIFQIVDALESIEKDFSKKLFSFLMEYMENTDFIVVSNPLASISGRNKLKAKKYWLENFLEEQFTVVEKFEMFQEKFIILRKKQK